MPLSHLKKLKICDTSRWTFVGIICVVPEPGSIRLKTKQTMAAGNGKIGMAETRSITYHFFLAKKDSESGVRNKQ